MRLAYVIPVLVMHTLDAIRYGDKIMFRKKARAMESCKKNTRRKSNRQSSASDSSENHMQERPRICLIDVESELSEALKSRGMNCFTGTLGPLVEIPNAPQHAPHHCLPNSNFPSNMHEYDIVIVDLQTPKTTPYISNEHKRTKCKGQEQFYLVSSYPETLFDPRALSASVLKDSLRPLMEKDSILIVFTAPQEEVDYQTIAITANGPCHRDPSSYSLYNFYSDLPEWNNVSGKDTVVVAPEDTSIGSLLYKHNKDTVYTIAFDHPQHWQDDEMIKSKNFIPLMTMSGEKIISFAYIRKKNFTFFFPTISDKKGFLCELLEKVLPGIIPQLFPYNTQFSWLSDQHYQLPNEEQLNAQYDRLKAEYNKKLDDINMLIDANHREYSYLHSLITETGDSLVKAVESLLNWMEFKEIVNVDEINPEIKEEDLRVKVSEGLLVIEVKGIGGTSTDSECSQISKIKFRRSKERGSFDVFGLY